MRLSIASAIILFAAFLAGTTTAQPTHLSGSYEFECHSASLTLQLLLAVGTQNSNGGSNTVPIYCGGDGFDEYQERLDTAKSNFYDGCNQLLANLNQPPRPDDCMAAADDWRQNLVDLNEAFAGLAPKTLDITVDPGNWWNWVIGAWNTDETLILQNDQELNLEITIGREGQIWSIALQAGANINNPYCAGALAVASSGQLDDQGTSTLLNNYGGLLTCGVFVGDLWLSAWLTVGADAQTKEV